MSDQPQGTDNYPVINSFLTTIHEHPAVTTQRDHSPSPRQTAQSFTKQVDQWYEAEARALQANKQKEIIKQTRLRQLEDEFEAQRLKKQKDWEEKFSNIEKNKSKNLMNIQQKFHKFSIRHNKVFTKMQDQHLKELQEHYDSRKAYDITNSKHYRLINSSQHSSTDSRHRSMRDSKTKTLQQEMASTKMNEISQRLEKAKTLSKQRQEEAINKVRNHNIFELYQVQAKAKEQYDDYFKLYASKIIEKMESADLVKDKVDKKLEKQNEERHKAYSEKLKRIQTNLIQLQEQQEQKFDELTKKLQKTPNRDRDSRDQRETSHHRRFLSNLQQLQRQKMSRADQIIQKHQEITLKNRLFKQRKQQLHKNLKVESH